MNYNNTQSELNRSNELFLRDEIDSCSGCFIVPNGEILCQRFIIKKLLCSEIQSTVYVAEDTLKEIDVVLKIVDIGPHQEKTPGILLKLEMDVCKNLFSDNIIGVYDLHYADIGGTSLLMLSMEYFGGQTFHQWLSNCTDISLRREKGLEWFRNVCQGIGAAHDAGIIHLNINSENIFIKDTQLKILGFGTSNFVRINLINQGLNTDFITNKINPVYMSPELYNTPHPDELTPAADIYSLGILLYELSHPKCRTPFAGSYSSLKDFHKNIPFKKIETINNRLSDIIARCLEKSPGKRYQTAWELLDAIENKPSQKMERNEEPDELENKYHQAEEFYNEISQGIESEKTSLKFLLRLFKQAIDIFPDHPSGVIVQYKLFNLSQLYRTSMTQGIKAFQTQKWSEALQFFKQAHKIESGSGVLKVKIEGLKKIKQLKYEIDENIKTGDLEKARRLAHLTDFFIKEIKRSNT